MSGLSPAITLRAAYLFLRAIQVPFCPPPVNGSPDPSGIPLPRTPGPLSDSEPNIEAETARAAAGRKS